MILLNRQGHSFILEWLLTAAMAFILLWTLVFTDTSRAVGNLVYDHMMRLHGFDRTQDIIIISIDNRTLAKLGAWPLSRKHYTQLLNQLDDPAFRPLAIGIDLLLLDSTTEDSLLAQAMRQHRVVLPVEFQLREDALHKLKIMRPSSAFESVATLAHINLNFDADGIIRGIETFSHGLPQLGIAMHGLNDPQVQTVKHHDTHRRFHMVDPKIGFPTISLADVLEKHFPMTLFKDKYVLIGVSAPGLGDRYPTLYAGKDSQSTPGVDIIASILKSSIEHTLISSKYSSTAVFLVFGFILLVMLISLLRLSPRRNFQFTLFIFCLSLVVSYALLTRLNIWIDPTPIMLVLLVLQPIWSWRRLESILYLVRQKTLDLKQEDFTSGMPAGLRPSQDIVQRYSQLLGAAVNAARDQLDFLERVVNELPDAVIIFDHNNQLLLKNKMADHLILASKMHIGQARDVCCQLLNIPDSLIEPDLTKPLHGDSASHPIIRLFDTTGAKDFLFKTAYLHPGLGKKLQIMILTEITELLRIQAQRDRALSFLSHDMRTPIASILAVSSEATKDNQTQLHEKISHHAHLLLRMVDDFIMTIQVESTTYHFQEQLLDNLLDDAIEQISDLAKARSIRMINGSDPIEAFIRADSKLLVRALMNLLVNAIKFSPEGGQVDITSALLDNDRVALTIRNPIASHPTRTVNDQAQGFGLGLHFVDDVIAAHHAVLIRDIPASGWARIEIHFLLSTILSQHNLA